MIARPLDIWVERGLTPLDAVRGRLLRWSGALGRRMVRDRDARVGLWALFYVAWSLLLVLLVPLWVLALGPILLGVPHVRSDLRYCVTRPGFHRRPALIWAALPAVLAVAMGAPLWVGFAAPLAVVLLGLGPLGAGGASTLGWRLLLACLALGLLLWARAEPAGTRLAVAHGHHAVALLLWWAWRPRDGRSHLPAILASLVVGAAMLAGAFDPILDRLGAWGRGPGGLPLNVHLRSVATGVGGDMGVRLVLFYAWAQSLHYGIWLRLIPEDDRDRPSPRTWVRTWRALRDELGVAVVLGTVALTLGLALWAAWDLAAARGGYLRFVRFHGFLELAAGAVFLVEGRPVRPVEEAPA